MLRKPIVQFLIALSIPVSLVVISLLLIASQNSDSSSSNNNQSRIIATATPTDCRRTLTL